MVNNLLKNDAKYTCMVYGIVFSGMLKEAETLEADRGTISTAWYSMSVGMYFYR